MVMGGSYTLMVMFMKANERMIRHLARDYTSILREHSIKDPETTTNNRGMGRSCGQMGQSIRENIMMAPNKAMAGSTGRTDPAMKGIS